MRTGGRDSMFTEEIIDGGVDLVLCAPQLIDIGDEDTQGEAKRTFTDTIERRTRAGIAHDFRMLESCPEEKLAGQCGIGSVSDHNLERRTDHPIGEGPVYDLIGDERLVGDDNFFAIRVDDRRRADADLGDRSRVVSDRDKVANPNWPLE